MKVSIDGEIMTLTQALSQLNRFYKQTRIIKLDRSLKEQSKNIILTNFAYNPSTSQKKNRICTMIDQLAKQFFSDIQGTLDKHAPHVDIPSSQIKAVIESGLKKLNLVTREEFDAQQAVLLRTREKLDALEKQVIHLESIIQHQNNTFE